jgi:hypothetical protein
VVFEDSFTSDFIRGTDGEFLFEEFAALQTIEGLKYFNTSNITSMRGMFKGCTFIEKIYFGAFKGENITDISFLFYNHFS